MHIKAYSGIFHNNSYININFFFQFNPTYRSSRPEVFCENSVLGNFANVTEKHLFARVSFLMKLQAQDLQFYLKKKKSLVQVFSCEFWEISKNTFLYKIHLVAASYILETTQICN